MLRAPLRSPLGKDGEPLIPPLSAVFKYSSAYAVSKDGTASWFLRFCVSHIWLGWHSFQPLRCGSCVWNVLWWFHGLGPKTLFPSAGSLGVTSSTNTDSTTVALRRNTVLIRVSLLSKLTFQVFSDIILGLASCQIQYAQNRKLIFIFSLSVFFPLLLYYSLFPNQHENLCPPPNISISSESPFSQVSYPGSV